jgi:plastocyanin
MRRGALGVLVVMAMVAATMLGVAAPAQPMETPQLSTPQLIERAVAAGTLDRSTGNLYLAYALGAHRKLPASYRSDIPWDGTLPLLRLRQGLARETAGSHSAEIRNTLSTSAANNCGGEIGGANSFQSTHFYIDYGTIGGGLTIADYGASLDASRNKEVGTYGWALPPLSSPAPPSNKYHVVVSDLGSGLYGFVSSGGSFAEFVGNNPNTAWNDVDAYASCMALNRDYSAFPGTSQQALDATTAHEYNHSIQFGYGALDGAGAADSVFVEGGATWVEDEVFDSSNDNYNYLWPDFTRDMGQYTASPYPYWVVFRALTERFGAGVGGGGEQVMQVFWEQTSQGLSNNLTAMQAGLAAKGTTLADAYHAAAVALKFNRACGGGYVYPYCLEEGPAYVTAAGATPTQGSISSVGGSFSGSVRDNYALNWIVLPSSGSAYSITLQNTSAGGQLRASAVCDTGSGLTISAFPAVVGTGSSTTLASFNPVGCSTRIAVITNQSQTAANPGSSALRSYTLSTSGGGGGGGDVTVADFSYSPTKLVVPAGTTVDWSFTGPSNHTVTSKTGLFDSGSKAPGTTFSFTFNSPGRYGYRCTIHPQQMRGTIRVQ